MHYFNNEYLKYYTQLTGDYRDRESGNIGPHFIEYPSATSKGRSSDADKKFLKLYNEHIQKSKVDDILFGELIDYDLGYIKDIMKDVEFNPQNWDCYLATKSCYNQSHANGSEGYNTYYAGIFIRWALYN